MSGQKYNPILANGNTITLMLQLNTQDEIDDDIVGQLTGQLKSELEDLDIESVAFMYDRVIPPGAKVVDPVTLGALMVVVLPAVLPKVVEFIHAWTLRSESLTVRIKVQRGDRSVEVEYPKTMAPNEAKKHIDVVMDELLKDEKH